MKLNEIVDGPAEIQLYKILHNTTGTGTIVIKTYDMDMRMDEKPVVVRKGKKTEGLADRQAFRRYLQGEAIEWIEAMG